ncbi:MAG: dinitrogenase iron-molybdenum cofactor biosynthesis protein [Candidatus Eisenbacteria bacterium]|nr:dinitrogenase iron-molybdenum cofactor biosynthesis protein [Candidatus Eisenbacteria bacterium]
MKVAITSTGPELASRVDPRFGRAAWFILFDTDTDDSRPVDNSEGVEAGSGAGVSAAETVVREGAEYLLTGHCGPNAFRTLETAGVKVIVGVDGTVGEAIEKLRSGELQAAGGPDVGPHSGV